MLWRRLERRGFDVSVANNGLDAIEKATRLNPELILMDLSLPVLDGWEATRRLKSRSATKTIPVIALTAHTTSDDRARSFSAGCDDFETKPVNFPRLVGKMTKLLGRSND
jgi:two-component system cell cycle response regulator DivK